MTKEELLSQFSADLLMKIDGAANEAELAQILKENGISVSPDELLGIIGVSGSSDSPDGILTEMDLEDVTGGVSNPLIIFRRVLKKALGILGSIGSSTHKGSGGTYGGGGHRF